MSVALALIAMLIELCFGYPDAVLNVIGHPVTWIGRLIDALDDWLNRDAAAPSERRSAGVLAVMIFAAVVGGVALVVEYELLRLPLGILVAGLIGSTLVAQRSLNRHVADVAAALDKGGIAAGRIAAARIVGRDTAELDAAGVARAAIESLA